MFIYILLSVSYEFYLLFLSFVLCCLYLLFVASSTTIWPVVTIKFKLSYFGYSYQVRLRLVLLLFPIQKDIF